MDAAILKDQVRKDATARRDALSPDERQGAGEAIAAHALPIAMPSGAVVSGFMPMRTEISPIPLMRKLVAAGAKLALPVVAGRGNPLIMRAWAFGDALETGAWNIPQPRSGAPVVDPDILIVPLLAFDRSGHRIGYGAGYYDMTINRLRAMKPITTVGIAFATQEIPKVPTTERDAQLDLVLTEREVIDCRKT
jgi:5-formyltetrahydrofolate cyclo-ligase